MPSSFIRKLQHGAHLSPEDAHALESLARSVQRTEPRQDIFEQGDRPRHLTLVLEGWGCRYKLLENGRRQIIGFFLPGDLCEPFGTLPRFMDHAIGALTPLTFARVRPEEVKAAAQASPRIEEALWWDALTASAIQHERVVSLGRRQAVERLGHLLCELQLRLQVVGRGDKTGFDLPLTQADLADALGLSTVHINRSLQTLRSAGLIASRGRRLVIHDLAALWHISLFDPAYLHLGESGQDLR